MRVELFTSLVTRRPRSVIFSTPVDLAISEVGASQWSIDHLFLDQDGIPTLVEVKRQSDSRIRREVVGQMLDYAANCLSYWSIEMLQTGFEKTCKGSDRSAESVLSELIGPEQPPEVFWGWVKTNLLAGRIRLLFVADAVPIELRRIVEFMNKQMSPAEVLALELRQFAGHGLKTLVPVLFGQTQEASRKHDGSVRGQPWDEERLFSKLAETVGPQEVQVARQIFECMKAEGRALAYGTGLANGSVYPILKPNGVRINPVYLSSDGRIWLQFGSLQDKPIILRGRE